MPVVTWPLTVFVELHRGLSGLRCTGSHPQVELWDGAMTEVADVPAIYGVDSSESMEHLTAVLQAEIASSDTVFLEPRKAFPQSTRFMVNKVVTDTVVKKLGGTVSGLNRQVDSLRAVKSEAEVALISTACQQATEAIHMGLCIAPSSASASPVCCSVVVCSASPDAAPLLCSAAASPPDRVERTHGCPFAAMLASRPGVTEHELSAVVDYGCRLHGAVGPSFPAVVAGGPRALTLHYHPSADGPAVDDGDMVLMDFGASHLGYASDISRTWPIAGKYSAPQRELYDAVLRTQQQCIDMCTADGTMSLSQIQQSSMLFTAQELIKLGILKADDVAGANGAHLVRQFYPHSIGHYLGMDVHDVPSCPLNRPLAPGMVVTIEPGLYIPDTPDVPARFRGLGIRIEDDVLVTEDGPRVLTAGCVKSPDEVEHKLQGQV